MSARIAVFVTHPVQYHTPIWRKLAAHPDVDLEVFFFSDHSVRGGVDAGFGQKVAWDVPLLEGYRHTFLRRDADLSCPAGITIADPHALLQEGGFTHVLIHGYTHGFERQVVRAADRLGLRTIVRGEFADAGNRRGPLKRLLRDLYLRMFYSRADAFCYVGVEAHRHLSRFVREDQRLYFSPYSVDSDLFVSQRSGVDRDASREALGLGKESFAFLFSGKLIPRKDPLLLVEAVARLPKSANAELIVVGDGPLRDAVVDRGQSLLGSRFHFRGFVNQSKLGVCYGAADAFVLPSRYEAWGLVANEAMHFSLPIVLSDAVNSHEDLVVPSRTGFVFRAGDVDSLTASLAMLAQDPERARAMGGRAETHVQRYSTDATVSGLVAAIQGAPQEVASV